MFERLDLKKYSFIKKISLLFLILLTGFYNVLQGLESKKFINSIDSLHANKLKLNKKVSYFPTHYSLTKFHFLNHIGEYKPQYKSWNAPLDTRGQILLALDSYRMLNWDLLYMFVDLMPFEIYEQYYAKPINIMKLSKYGSVQIKLADYQKKKYMFYINFTIPRMNFDIPWN